MLTLKLVLCGMWRPRGRRDAGKSHRRSVLAFVAMMAWVGRSSGAATRNRTVAIPLPMDRSAMTDRDDFHGKVPVDERGVSMLGMEVGDALPVDARATFRICV